MNLFVIFGILAAVSLIVMGLDKVVLHSDMAAKGSGEKPPAYIALAYSWGPLVIMVFVVLFLVNYMNFTFILTLATFISLIVVLINRLFFVKKRKQAVVTYKEVVTEPDQDIIKKLEQGPAALEFIRSIFPVLLIVFILRSFLVEPFQIPSGSMLPTLKVGDFILVNKYAYGLRMPVINKIIVPIGEPKRGNVVVFHYPPNPNVDYIKRLIGVPGDKIAYKNNQLYINGQLISEELVGKAKQPRTIQIINSINDQVEERTVDVNSDLYIENLLGVKHDIYKIPSSANRTPKLDEEWTVPDGYYFMMGDNRDNSLDSRFWITDYAVQKGYMQKDDPISVCYANTACSEMLKDDRMYMVPADQVVGKAFLVWMHWPAPKLKNIPSFSNDRFIQ